VKLDKLARQFRRDLAANPKKAAALGVMVAVALYCWGPLLWGWAASGRGDEQRVGELASLILTDDPVEATEKARSRSKARFRWETVRPLLAQDPRMASAALEELWLDPFARSAADSAEHSEVAAAEAARATASPGAAAPSAERPLVLSSIAISARRRSAMISGARYGVGDWIGVTNQDGSTLGEGYRVVNIEPHQVELDRQGQNVVLRLERSRLASGDEIGHGAGSHKP
jgi:hypothetical protein